MSKLNYVPQRDRKKILLLGDDLRFPSGVGTMCKEIIYNTAQTYNWIQLAAGINHPDAGKVLDISDDVNREMTMSDASVKLYPNSGYGDMQILRSLMRIEKPDAIMIFTDPRYWIWLFQAEREIRSQVPIIYYNIWDNLPYPMWNKPYYESCDGLFAISKQTLNINRVVLGEKAEGKVLKYIPHGVSEKFYPLGGHEISRESLDFMKKVRGNKDFVLLYNARNLGRKRTADLLLAWRHFCDMIGKNEAKKCRLVLHTDPVDNAGTDLFACYNAYCSREYVNVVFDGGRYSTEQMNLLYNACDGVILVSSAEGWGLSLTEALMTGKMFIAPISGGMQDQMRFVKDPVENRWIDFCKTFPSNHTNLYKCHGEWCIPISVAEGRSLVGSPMTPYIFDDRCSIENIAEAIKTLYDLPADTRKEYGMKGHDWAVSEEAGFTAKQMGDRMNVAIQEVLENFKVHPRQRFELIKVDKDATDYIDYDPVNYKDNE